MITVTIPSALHNDSLRIDIASHEYTAFPAEPGSLHRLHHRHGHAGNAAARAGHRPDGDEWRWHGACRHDVLSARNAARALGGHGRRAALAAASRRAGAPLPAFPPPWPSGG